MLLIIVWPILYITEIVCPDGIDEVNDTVTVFMYIPTAFIFTGIFTAFNIAVLPFAYIYQLTAIFLDAFT